MYICVAPRCQLVLKKLQLQHFFSFRNSLGMWKLLGFIWKLANQLTLMRDSKKSEFLIKKSPKSRYVGNVVRKSLDLSPYSGFMQDQITHKCKRIQSTGFCFDIKKTEAERMGRETTQKYES